MKKTPLVRKTPLKQKTGLKQHKALKPKAFCKTPRKIAPTHPHKPKSKIQMASGLKGKGRTPDEIAHHGDLAGLGCFVCNWLALEPTTHLIVHHIDGRYQGGENDVSEWLTFCLCNEHHDPSVECGMSTKGLSVHHNKSLFKSMVGTEIWCVYESFRQLSKKPLWIDSELWSQYLLIMDKSSQELWILDNARSPKLTIDFVE